MSKSQVAAKPSASASGGSASAQSPETDQNTLGDTGKNNLLPTIIVLSVVIGFVAIVSVRRKARQ
ncbi:MAG: LPXTG cell wall anchor domain-containing protein [Sedimentisphaerales bacterium]